MPEVKSPTRQVDSRALYTAYKMLADVLCEVDRHARLPVRNFATAHALWDRRDEAVPEWARLPNAHDRTLPPALAYLTRLLRSVRHAVDLIKSANLDNPRKCIAAVHMPWVALRNAVRHAFAVPEAVERRPAEAVDHVFQTVRPVRASLCRAVGLLGAEVEMLPWGTINDAPELPDLHTEASSAPPQPAGPAVPSRVLDAIAEKLDSHPTKSSRPTPLQAYRVLTICREQSVSEAVTAKDLAFLYGTQYAPDDDVTGPAAKAWLTLMKTVGLLDHPAGKRVGYIPSTRGSEMLN